jgi:hypothetical protein
MKPTSARCASVGLELGLYRFFVPDPLLRARAIDRLRTNLKILEHDGA